MAEALFIELIFMLTDKTKIEWLNIGKVFGVSELFVNGENAGIRWYGRRIYPVKNFKKGKIILKLKL